MPRSAMNFSMPFVISMADSGLTKLAVPTATAVAPAMSISRASWAFMTPPMPMMGASGNAWCTSYTARTASGRVGGEGGPGRAAHAPAERRPAGLDVDRHPYHGVDEAEALSSRVEGGPGD